MSAKKAAMFPVLFFLIWAFFSLARPWDAQASTVAIIGGSASQDGRPLLMKLRDNEDPDQEFVYNADGPYAYIGVTYADVTNQAWGGVNEAGFAIHNSNAWNFDDLVPGPDDDGFIIRLALRTCATVDDFQAIMDSTNLTGRTRCANYGVVDSTGDGAFFEAASYVYYRHDLSDSAAAPNGYMVRANFAYSGGSYHLGQHRHDRVLALLDSAYAGNFITHNYVTQIIQRDLVNEETDPYPLPFEGREGLLPYGLLHTHEAINRDISRSGLVIQGILPGEDPLLATLWALVGEPIVTPALPLWVRAASVPPEFDSPGGSPLNFRVQELRDYVYQQYQWASDGLDTWRLLDDRVQGLLPYLTAAENGGFVQGDSALLAWRSSGLPTAAEVAAFQNAVTAQIYAQLVAWGPPAPPEVTMQRMPSEQVRLDWAPVTVNVFGRPLNVTSYTIYTSDQPFYDRYSGDSLTTVSLPPVTLPAEVVKDFFQVRCRP